VEEVSTADRWAAEASMVAVEEVSTAAVVAAMVVADTGKS